MRRSVWIVAPIVLFALFFTLRKVLPFLDTQMQEIYATPTTQPTDTASLATIQVPGKGGRVCLDGVSYGPGAKWIYVTARAGKYPTGPIRIEARARGYRAATVQRGGLLDDAPIIVPIKPAPREVGSGTLCLRNTGRHRVGFYGIHPGRGSSPTQTTVDGKPLPEQLSLTLLTSPSKSLGSRLGTMFDHVAAFRPMTGWQVWLLALLVGIGGPVAIAFALLRAAAEDELPPRR
jgi:hypothetical protein